MLKKLFGSGKKNDGFYLELDEIKDSKVVKDVVETASQVAEAAKEQVEEIVTAETATAKQSESKTKSQPKAQKSEKAVAKAQKQSTPTTKANQANSGASSFEPPFWVKAMYNNSGNGSSGQKTEPTFATDYLMPTVTKYRRRPGPSLNKFKDMANKTRSPRG